MWLSFIALTLFSASVLAVDPPFPNLPNQFIADVEANILNRGYTVQVTEYFDSPGDRVRLEVLRNGSRHITVDDFQNGFTYRTNMDTRTCMASNASRPSNRIATTGSDGIAHLSSISDFLLFGKQYHDRYVGEAIVRGITCQQWTAVYTNTTSFFNTTVFQNYTMQWYFAKRTNWSMPVGTESMDTAIPVQLDLVGVSNFSRPATPPTGPPPTGPPPSIPLHTFHHIYEFTNFRIGSQATMDPELFNPPDGILCTGLPVAKDLPQIPSQFSFSTQGESTSNNTGFMSYYAYDAQRQETVTIYDFESRFNLSGNITIPDYVYGRHRIIHNYREGTQYNITQTTCSQEKIADTQNRNHEFLVTSGHASLQTGNDVFRLTPDQNLTYQGFRTVRGIPAELWVVVRNSSFLVPSAGANQTSLWSYYFSTTTWRLNTYNGEIMSTRVPLELRIHSLVPGYEDSNKLYMTIADYVVGPPRSHLFDDSTCFTSAQQETVSFILDTSFDNNNAYSMGLRQQLSLVMNVTIDRFHVDTYPGTSNYLNVLVRIHDVPTVGDPSLLAGLTSRQSAVSKLRNSVRRGQFYVMGAIGSTRAQTGSYSSSTQDTKTTFSSSEMAGLAVGVLILGLAIGAGLVFVYHRRATGASAAFSYQKE